jgi:hypothetical protein
VENPKEKRILVVCDSTTSRGNPEDDSEETFVEGLDQNSADDLRELMIGVAALSKESDWYVRKNGRVQEIVTT